MKLRDDVGRLTDRTSRKHFSDTGGLDVLSDFDFSEGHGILGILAAIVMAVLMALAAILVIWLVGAVLWTGILILAALLY